MYPHIPFVNFFLTTASNISIAYVELQKEVDDPDLRKGFLQESLRKRENNEMDDIQTLMIINRIKRKLNYKEKVGI